MIAPPERSAERDAALDALVPHVPFDGWTFRALRTALRQAGGDPRDAESLFPRGAADMVDAWCDLADRRMEAGAAALGLEGQRTPARVRAVIALRLAQQRVHREAIRRALAVLAWPGNARTAVLCTARTVDAIWHAAGDHAADFSWYTKRAILSGIWCATVLFWLRDASEEDAATLAFLDRRLAAVGRITRMRRRFDRFRFAAPPNKSDRARGAD